jgi:hypothetical protein
MDLDVFHILFLAEVWDLERAVHNRPVRRLSLPFHLDHQLVEEDQLALAAAAKQVHSAAKVGLQSNGRQIRNCAGDTEFISRISPKPLAGGQTWSVTSSNKTGSEQQQPNDSLCNAVTRDGINLCQGSFSGGFVLWGQTHQQRSQRRCRPPRGIFLGPAKYRHQFVDKKPKAVIPKNPNL